MTTMIAIYLTLDDWKSMAAFLRIAEPTKAKVTERIKNECNSFLKDHGKCLVKTWIDSQPPKMFTVSKHGKKISVMEGITIDIDGNI
jgi:hypothetical protein